ncbi:hypothetical protein PanWU01x14_341210 [Parasponia andersonii]|uniref:Uncharacterized protein n=1 Tax=Parasponia andersonii TaxID=3476 RepID=A0A2P5AE67_PARAD|nr:hypothetical protein PanWU01x14_341210 [Parasponia andersonii]
MRYILYCSGTPDSGSKSGATCLGGEIAELSGGAPRLKSRLSFPPPVPIKRRHEVGSFNEEEGRAEKRSRVAPSCDSDDDGATPILLRRRRSVHSSPPRGDAPPPAVADGTPGGVELSSVTTATASGACPTGGEGALTASEAELCSPGTGNAQREGPATEPELEALSLKNVELVTSRTFTQLAAIWSFYSSRIRDLFEELNSRSALAERSEAVLAELSSDLDLYWSLEEARVSSAVAHALSVERTRHEELAARLVEAEADKLAQSEAARLAQNELRVMEQELQSAGAEMGLAFVARDRAVDDAKEARKAEVKAKLEAHSLQRRLDWSNDINRYLFLDHKNLMGAHVEMSRKHSEDLASINTFLIDLSLVALKDRLVDVEKLKTRYQRQMDVLSVESYRSGWENREFEGHAELGDEISITYPVDVLKMLTAEKDGPSTSASGAKELIPIFGPPDRTSEAPGGQLGLGVSTGQGSGAVIISSDESDPGTPPSTGVGPSARTGRAPLAGGN